MATAAGAQQGPGAQQTPQGEAWYARSPEDVTSHFGVDPAAGLTAAAAADLLKKNGPNALPAEKPKPGWRRFLDEYRSYMQIILLVAGVFSLVIGQFHTGVMLLILTVINAVVGLREEGKAESAMNALKSMMKATARVRRDGAEAQIPAEEVVAGDVVLLAAGDQVPADGRIVAGERPADRRVGAHRRERPGRPRTRPRVTGAGLGPGDQTNMAFMNTPVTHGSGVMIVTGTGADTEVGKIAGMLSATKDEETPLTKQLNRMTLWIGAAARPDDDRDVRPRPARAARRGTRSSSPPSRWPSRPSRRRCPTVSQVILSHGRRWTSPSATPSSRT